MFDPKNHIHWVAAIVIAILLILILGAAATPCGLPAAAPLATLLVVQQRLPGG